MVGVVQIRDDEAVIETLNTDLYVEGWNRVTRTVAQENLLGKVIELEISVAPFRDLKDFAPANMKVPPTCVTGKAEVGDGGRLLIGGKSITDLFLPYDGAYVEAELRRELTPNLRDEGLEKVTF
jgi:hypothetical protein